MSKLQENIDDLVNRNQNWKRSLTEIEKDVNKFCLDNDCIDKKPQILENVVSAAYQDDETIKML